MSMTPTQVATAAYAAMCEPPPHVALYNAVRSAPTADAGIVLLSTAPAELRDAATHWAAQPESRERERRLAWLREDTRRVGAVRTYYADNLAQFISDWGLTTDPRRLALNQPAQVPFALFPKQVVMVDWMLERWRTGTSGCVVKGRDVGASYVAMALLASLCIFTKNFAAGVASATEAKLDLSGSPDTLYAKLREFLGSLPPEFNGGYNPDRNAAYCRITIPETGSTITGEAGALAGRGARKAIYVVDESAFFPQSIDAALSQTTNVRIDISTPNGIGNSFYERAHNAAIPRFDLGWRDRPDRDQAWYDKQVATLDPVVLAQEVNADFAASREGVVIPSAWVQSSIDADKKLGLTITGARVAALDIGGSRDRCAMAIRRGVVLERLESWSGAGSNMARSVAKAFAILDEEGLDRMWFDAESLAADAVRGIAEMLNSQRPHERQTKVLEHRGSSAVLWPEAFGPGSKIKNKDRLVNYKAQCWISGLRHGFEQTHRAVIGATDVDPDSMVIIRSGVGELSTLCAQLCQPTASANNAGKYVVDKLGEGEKSPDLADAVCMAFAPRKLALKISDRTLMYAGMPAAMPLDGGSAMPGPSDPWAFHR